jgi:hypothetical protein
MVRRKIRHGGHVALHSRRSMWYVYGTSGQKMYVYGGFDTESEAMTKGYGAKDWNGEPECILLPTSDLSAAKSMIKAKLIDKTGSLQLATQRMYKGNDRYS